MRRSRLIPPTDGTLDALAARVRYVGSAEHKSYPSEAGPPALRKDATPCDQTLGDFETFSSWIASAIRKGRIGAPWEVDFPRYVWVLREQTWYEARLVNPIQGTYKGYELGIVGEPWRT